MKNTGIIRRFDDLGRIVIPKEVRRLTLGTDSTEGVPMEIFYDDDGCIILKKHIPENDKFVQLSKHIHALLKNAPPITECNDAEIQIYDKMAHLKNALSDNGFDK